MKGEKGEGANASEKKGAATAAPQWKRRVYGISSMTLRMTSKASAT